MKYLIEMFITFFMIVSIFLLIVFDAYYQPTMEQIYYRDASVLVNNINFNELKWNTGDFPNGIKINTEPSIKYPDDIVVHYNDITLSVENDNGFAKVVAAFDCNGREINYPTTKELEPGYVASALFPLAIGGTIFLLGAFFLFPYLL